MRVKLTKRLLDGLQPQAETYAVQDKEVPGFEVRVLANGRKVFYCYYRFRGQRRRPMIGEFGELTVDQAREEARRIRAKARLGTDHSKERQEERKIETFDQFAKVYMTDAARRTKPRTQEENQRRLDLYILPALGKSRLNAITRADVVALHQRAAEKRMVDRDGVKVTLGGLLAANRLLGLLRAMFNKAIEWELIKENPALYVEPYPEKSRERFLQPEELKALADALDWAEEIETLENATWKKDKLGKRHKVETRPSPHAAAAIRLLLFTGARRNEILTLRWDDVDLDGRCLRLADSKTGKKTIHLNTPAIETLKRLLGIRTHGNPWVIEGVKEKSNLVNIQSSWERIRERAGLPDLRLHDLRHVHASMAVMSGMNLPIVARLLGHSTTRMTERYAHLAADPVQAAAEQVGAALLEAMEGGAKVVDVTPAVADAKDQAEGGD